MFKLKGDTTAQNTHQQDLQYQKSKHMIQVAIWFKKQMFKSTKKTYNTNNRSHRFSRSACSVVMQPDKGKEIFMISFSSVISWT
jgi:hypothetical protein